MKRYLWILLAFVLMSYSWPASKKIKIFLAGDSTMSIKEKRVYPETGWGMPFVHFWDTTVIVENRAKNGRSTKTFIQEGIWQSIVQEAVEGDYVLIQFGHNDESVEKKERYTTPDSFKLNLTRFVEETRSKKAIPVLISPVSRRKFDKDGSAIETHKVYTPLVKEVADATQTLYIDLDAKSRTLYQRFGPEASRWLFLQLQPGEHPNYPDGREDNTHFNELGARLIAQSVLAELREKIPDLSNRIVMPIKK